MFVLVPAVVTGPNEVLSNRAPVDTALPAQFAEETLRVAVYAEDNTSLPSYATGGVYTDNYANVISLLESADYAVTALSTQDILDHKLMVNDFDVFVLPNQGPKESIVNQVKDYWLGGGGILNFAQSVGFCFYAGIIDPSYEGSDQIVTEWMWLTSFHNITIEDRHPVTKAYDAGDRFVQPGNVTFFNPVIATTTSDRYIPLGVNDLDPTAWNLFALDNPNRGGKFVHLPGNCSIISSWLEPIIIDAVDWLAPRPKGRILFDLSHLPAYGVDTWDTAGWTNEYYYTWRDSLVSRGYTFDKLNPSSAGNLTSGNLAGYDMLVLVMSLNNYTNAEISNVASWVNEGGGLLAMADWTFDLGSKQELNRLLGAYGLESNYTVSGNDLVNTYENHPIIEGCTTLDFTSSGALNYSGAAYPIWYDANDNTAVAGQKFGSGRIILTGDMDLLGHNQIASVNNFEFGVNVANWLSAATADVLLLVYNLSPTLTNIYRSSAADALNDLDISFYLTYTHNYMNLSIYSQQWSLVILDSAWPGLQLYFDDISSYLDTGGDLILSWYRVGTFQTESLYAKIGFEYSDDLPDKAPFHIWNTGHGIFNYPNNYEALNFTALDDYGDEGDLLTVYPNATALAGYTETGQPGNATIVLGFGGHALYNGYLIDQLSGDLDDSTYVDNFELWENEIAFMYYDRPTIDSPADVTYMETETGNEITWTPTADAGPWEYVFSVNGTPVESGPWTGGTFTFNVDGVNVSITEYELTVFDRLGYSASDLVILNVTEYIAPGPGPFDIDPMILLIIGAAVVGVVVILVVFMKRGKKE